MPRTTITRAFRNRMLRDAAMFAGALILLLLGVSRLLPPNIFALTALVLVVATALTFNIFQRRAIKLMNAQERRS